MLACVCQPTDSSRLLFGPTGGGLQPSPVTEPRRRLGSALRVTAPGSNISQQPDVVTTTQPQPSCSTTDVFPVRKGQDEMESFIEMATRGGVSPFEIAVGMSKTSPLKVHGKQNGEIKVIGRKNCSSTLVVLTASENPSPCKSNPASQNCSPSKKENNSPGKKKAVGNCLSSFVGNFSPEKKSYSKNVSPSKKRNSFNCLEIHSSKKNDISNVYSPSKKAELENQSDDNSDNSCRSENRRTSGGDDSLSDASRKSTTVSVITQTSPMVENRTPYSILSLSPPSSTLRSSRRQRNQIIDTFDKLPDGVQLTLGELREMAHRQQHQIDAQHQLLAAKEQRLRHLKEQEARHQRVATENERLRRLRDRVEAQELKLRKLRALRGQVDQNKQNNVLLTSDLDSIRALFNEKEKELSIAVAKVDELTRQLEELRRGRASRDQPPSAAALELEKLRRELMYRNKLNEQQNARLHQQREALTQRQEEMSNIDKRISELQDRLQRKRIMNQQLDTQLTTVSSKDGSLHGSQSGSAQIVHHPLTKQYSKGNVAAIEPYNHVPLMNHNDDKSSSVDKRLITGSAYYPSSVTNQSKNISDFNNLKNQNKEDYQGLKNKQSNSNVQKNDMNNDYITEFGASKSDPKYQTLPYNTKFSVNFMTTKTNRENTTDTEKLNSDTGESPQSNGSKSTGYQHMMVHSTPLSTVNKSLAIPLSQNDVSQEKQATQKPNDQKNGDIGSRLSGPGRGQPVGEPSNNISTPANVNFQKPISSVAPTSIHHTSNKPSPIYQTSSTKIQPVQPQTIKTSVQTSTPSSQVVSNQVVVLSPPNSSSTPITSPEVNLDKSKPVLPPKPAIKPPPRQMQPSTTDYELKDGNEAPVPPIPKSEPPLDSPPIHRYDNKPIKARPLTIKKQPLSEQPKLRNVSKLNGVHVSINRRIEMPPAFLFPEMETPPSDLINNENNSSTSNKQIANNNNDSKNAVRSTDEVDKSITNEEKNVVADLNQENKKNACESSSNDNKIDNVVRRVNKGNLKQSGKVNLSRRVSFDPLALLLDASLEGELELVKKTATQVANPSAANDEGITALHNAICAGHLEIVKFLVEFGCDVNAQDSDGWTPLHCAASCNNVAMVRFLVEHGACIFATTLSDHETAAEKCEEDEEGFDGCSEYLYSVQEKLGILYGGIVYAVFDYMAQQPDELSFTAGQQLTVIRKGDENEREWWWARLGDREGYVPRNLLGLYPRVASKSE